MLIKTTFTVQVFPSHNIYGRPTTRFKMLFRPSVTNPTVYNRSIYKYNLIDVYKYNLIDACINVFLESLERKFMLAIFMHGNLV